MKPESALKAIHRKCLDCSSGSRNEVKNCRMERCALYPYRMGHNPHRTGIGKIENLSHSNTVSEV